MLPFRQSNIGPQIQLSNSNSFNYTSFSSSPTLNSTLDSISRCFIDHEATIERLKQIAISFKDHSNFIFFTDGSLKPHHFDSRNYETSNPTQMGFGWACFPSSDYKLQPTTFHGATAFTPSSSEAESFGVISALLTCPVNSFIHIYTDSQNSIITFHHVMNPLTSDR